MYFHYTLSKFSKQYQYYLNAMETHSHCNTNTCSTQYQCIFDTIQEHCDGTNIGLVSTLVPTFFCYHHVLVLTFCWYLHFVGTNFDTYVGNNMCWYQHCVGTNIGTNMFCYQHCAVNNIILYISFSKKHLYNCCLRLNRINDVMNWVDFLM